MRKFPYAWSVDQLKGENCMDLGIRDRVAIVCASSKGIGKAAAEALGQEGVKLALCARHAEALEATATEIRSRSGVDVLAIPTDLRDGAAIDALVRQTLSHFGRLDILVNNTGGPPPGPFEQHDDAVWQAAFESLLLSVVRLTRLALPDMRRRNWGRIVTVTSTAVKQPITNLVLSNSLRAAVTGLSKSLANEVSGEGITVNTVAPGRILTDRLKSLHEG
ncbi:MAG: Polyketide synthase/Fatty acid synthase, partial [Chloroflexi bacterium]|nr:Polyketide synthase/Fatty acid synthase [Chloroflexota bacterium]